MKIANYIILIGMLAIILSTNIKCTETIQINNEDIKLISKRQFSDQLFQICYIRLLNALKLYQDNLRIKITKNLYDNLPYIVSLLFNNLNINNIYKIIYRAGIKAKESNNRILTFDILKSEIILTDPKTGIPFKRALAAP